MADAGKLLQRPFDYAYVNSESPGSYTFNQRTPVGLNLSTVQPTGATVANEIQFELTRDVINLFRSEITGQLTLTAAQGALVNFCANRPPVRSWRIITTSGQVLFQMDFCQEYFMGPRLKRMSMKDFLKRSLTDWCNPNRVSKTSLDALSMSPAAYNAGSLNETEPQYQVHSANGVNISRPISWRLGDLFPDDSLLSIDCDLRFPENLIMGITLAPQDEWFFGATSLNDSTVGATSSSNAVYSIANFRLNLATQASVPKIEAVRALCKSGFKLPIPFIRPNRYNILANAPSTSQDVQYGAGDGAEMRRIYVMVVNGTRNLGTFNDISNLGGRFVSNYQTKVGNTPLQMAALDCTGSANMSNISAFEFNRYKDGDSPLVQSQDVFLKNFCHMDDFQGQLPLGDVYGGAYQRGMIIGGIPLVGRQGSEQLMYNFTAVHPGTQGALCINIWAVCTKTLVWGDNLLSVI